MADERKHRQPQLSITQNIIDIAEKVLKLKDISVQLSEECIKIKDRQSELISTKLLRDMYNALRDDGQKIFLHEIVDGANFVLQPVALPPRNPELEARIQKLKIAEENKEYERMIRNVDSRGKKSFTFQDDVKSMNRQLVAMLNFALTVVAGFAFGYKGTELLFGRIFPMQMMSGLICGTIVFFVDLYFIMRYGL